MTGIERALAISRYLSMRNLPTTPDTINEAMRNLDGGNDEPVDPYKAGIEEYRAANVTPESRFEEEQKAARLRELDAEQREMYAHFAAHPMPRLTAAELDPYQAPDPYEAGIVAWRKENGR